MSKINQPVMSIARLARQMKHESRKEKIAVVVGTITNDLRIFEVPKLTVRTIWRCASGRFLDTCFDCRKDLLWHCVNLNFHF